MDMITLRKNAREAMKGFCRLCPVCDGRACAGEVPGMGGTLSGNAFTANHEALLKTKINLRVVHEVTQPDTSLDFLGMKLTAPIMNGPVAHPNMNCGPYDDYGFQEALSGAMQEAGCLYWMGDACVKESFMNGCRAIEEVGRGVTISKPHADAKNIRMRFEWAKSATAYGIDIDGAGLLSLRKIGFPVAPMSVASIRELRAYAPEKPFIIKGIMTPDDALRVMEAGVDCIVVSNHGGRVLDSTPGVADVLPAIRKAVGKDMMLLADGSVRSGVDVFKYIALGANAVLVGRPFCWGAYGGGKEGVRFMLDTYIDQLSQTMILTGCKTLADIGEKAVAEVRG